ncbi:hypothetical protein CDAR_106821 [Caerostris darwini]|uniref:Uncharacterized protein n=1 Tax=Caerostris darwini TaxID=1538125 RepID=A0AAV4P4Q7_9ARAC|nr:hypothetical protein CDAR_106821 [Caerostris darwini]
MTGDILLSNMLFRYRDLPIGIKMPDSPESLIKNQITSNSSNSIPGVNGNHSPNPSGGTPLPHQLIQLRSSSPGPPQQQRGVEEQARHQSQTIPGHPAAVRLGHVRGSGREGPQSHHRISCKHAF